MFTGIIKGKFPVVSIADREGLRSFIVQLSPELVEGLSTGASVAIDGVCFTVTQIDGTRVSFDAMEETLRKTTIGSLKENDHVNIERSARIGDEIGGHVMSGHVSTMAEIVAVNETENNKAVTFKVSPEWMRFIFSKGFISLDGASLTVVDADKINGTFQVWFIPETLRITKFGEKGIGDRVNLEIDPQTQVIVETVENYLRQQR
ncbi:riboflavin synthase subunit alpha [Candidatus Uhrbacteria bacterium RIFCSPHIGHO2_02_FULL_47_44]|uniref:Riboflavin synthase n=1 Tax=Candidatus Uhrbacteria bacterium RIFCSPLOWO2_02_FULL_48_18 TaxID=1802408 RepID=A0A1F7VCA9_9BACT|nr:MAG: riboflavin synthase subunit alpha [Candidatus Uhrbacteria bacterium RIFCSPHIGHO2_01_FULL_47_10]OGL71790.1 MAG: riboflavin synthase subunit alpha [Candidatus Uhrbacteria bacterium RIFCSPHIGHO2_02_FULL_47_44]OGL77818.1 MAG: riboflavin synthase subunit alpha [Candidatus Uhrbacteria bacterium RIFCSPHIGHO2_12_FULL_47_12]OGL80637.1 MAG: riboflavin synthase subunit alpha [Candidatus Uhrbacteria bacterium RIFCSPLOWO2_01_FULL_47_17]OGL88180.1 MAG: riboflavin synthase subunit alpha [Candidatus Uh